MDVMMLVAIAALVVLLACAWWLVRRGSARRGADATSGSSRGKVLSTAGQGKQALAVEQASLERPSRIVVAAGDEEVMSMTVVDEARLTTLTRHAVKADAKAFSKVLEPIMQVAPSMATAAMAGSSQLMEVVVNGPLVAAADGNGLRAFTMGANGIQEHARLFEPSNLQNVANAAAIWQLASVVVAQKHLADISATLKRVESKVDGIQSFMEEQRLAVIQSVMHYLDDTRKALGRGEFLERTRDKLEDFDIELERAGMSLTSQIRRESGSALEQDTAGCEGEYTSALAKHRGIKQHVEELTLCNEVRLANWYPMHFAKLSEARISHQHFERSLQFF